MRVKNALLPGRRLRLVALQQQRDLWVNVACGREVLPGFINLDLYPCRAEVIGWDCRRSLPLADGSAAGIRVDHFVEHLDPRDELPALLRDCLRALRPGGVLRIVVPDAERYLRAYCGGDFAGFRELAVPEPLPRDLPTRMDIVNHVFHQWHEHRWAYDFENLSHRLITAGFRHVHRSEYKVSVVAELAEDCMEHAPYSLYVEAIR